MARLGVFVLVFSFLLYMPDMASSASTTTSSPTDYIVASCKTTRYPALCVQCLSGYAKAIRKNDQHLAQTALSVSLSRAKSAAAYVAKMTQVRGIKTRERQAVKDCIENMGDSVDRLSQSVKELGHMGRAVGKVMDGSIKVAVRRRVVHVAQVTSNALALVNRFAARHRRPATLTEQP
ncbi:hypothetical protein V6N12_044234 [Hibiscus sabdariffa]|uniref:Pectinesterase inhibitor domain-containing protein n=1 Tax=Hibiscus sabdariffa TaxID=183260 RepID=A0ABR2DGN4_9ROSI